MADPICLMTPDGEEPLDIVDFEARVRRGEVPENTLLRHPLLTGGRLVAVRELELYRRLHRPDRAHFARLAFLRFPWLTTALICLNLAVFLLASHNGRMGLDEMVRWGAKVGPLIADLGQVWRLLTANVLHRDWVHLGLNLGVLALVGGALENTYRRLDYVLVLLVTGLASMGASWAMTDAVTIGASGLVFGCLGGLLAFGLKYRSVLPARYRRVLGDAAVPTVLGLLLIGVTSKGVDTWAHLGGLVAGLALGALIRPELLCGGAEPWRTAVVRALAPAALLAVVGVGSAWAPQVLPLMRLEVDDDFGLAMPIPREWKRGADPLGSLAWYNGLPGAGRASVAAEAIGVSEDVDASAEAARFVSERLSAVHQGARIGSAEMGPPQVTRVGDRPAARVVGRIVRPEGSLELEAWLVPRGRLVFQLVFLWPEDFDRYRAVVDQMVAGIRFVEPRGLRWARGEALFFPSSAGALGRLGAELSRAGELGPAAEAFRGAVRADPEALRWRVALARALIELGAVEAGCEAAQAALAYDARDAAALEADARCELSRGNPRRALERLDEARAAAPNDEGLGAAAAKLRASLAEVK